MSMSRMTFGWSAAILACGLAGPELAAQQTEMKVAAVDTKVDVVTLQAGEAFSFDDATLGDLGKAKLDGMLDVLEGEYVFRVDVSGYTDRIGDEDYNLQLSGERAQAAADYLTTGGIPAERIKVQAMGSADPLVACENVSGDELIACLAPNRRTEVRFFYPRARTEAIIAVKQKLSTAAGDYVAIYGTEVQSTSFGTKAIEVFMEGCRPDIDTYCDQVTPGGQRLMACIFAHNDKVSDECKRNVRDSLLLVKADIAQANLIGKMCGSDILAQCSTVEPGDGRIEACLADNRDALSERCRRGLDSIPR
jgi:outer membrane protein OmpA-like peptidoglycan-associated protein